MSTIELAEPGKVFTVSWEVVEPSSNRTRESSTENSLDLAVCAWILCRTPKCLHGDKTLYSRQLQCPNVLYYDKLATKDDSSGVTDEVGV